MAVYLAHVQQGAHELPGGVQGTCPVSQDSALLPYLHMCQGHLCQCQNPGDPPEAHPQCDKPRGILFCSLGTPSTCKAFLADADLNQPLCLQALSQQRSQSMYPRAFDQAKEVHWHLSALPGQNWQATGCYVSHPDEKEKDCYVHVLQLEQPPVAVLQGELGPAAPLKDGRHRHFFLPSPHKNSRP